MPRRSSLLDVPERIRAEFNQQLVRSGFSDYEGLTDWLNQRLDAEGLELRISKTAAWRHGKDFEERLERVRIATEQAKALAEGADDDEGDMNEALIRMVQTRTFEVLMELGDDIKPGDLNKIGLLTARLTRASVKAKEWKQDMRKRAEAKLAELEDEFSDNKADPRAILKRVREDIYGLYDE